MPKPNSLLPLPLSLSELILLVIKGRGIKETKTWGREARVLFPRMSSPKRGQNKTTQNLADKRVETQVEVPA